MTGSKVYFPFLEKMKAKTLQDKSSFHKLSPFALFALIGPGAIGISSFSSIFIKSLYFPIGFLHNPYTALAIFVRSIKMKSEGKFNMGQ